MKNTKTVKNLEAVTHTRVFYRLSKLKFNFKNTPRFAFKQSLEVKICF